MFRHLLVPLDGSSLAESALPAAAALGARFGSRVTVLHVLERHPPSSVHGAPHLREAGRAEAYLGEVTRWLRGLGVSPAAHVHAPRSEVSRSIAEHAAELGADLVVLCTHGKRDMRGFLFGRIAQQALSRGSVPVLAVPGMAAGRTRDFPVSRLLVPLDDTPDAGGALPFALALARGFGAEILLVRVVPTIDTVSGGRGAATLFLPTASSALLEAEAEEAAARLEDEAARLRQGGAGAACAVRRGDPVRQIAQAAIDHRSDLIIVATHGHAGVATLWSRSFAARMLEATDCPVLLVRAQPSSPD